MGPDSLSAIQDWIKNWGFLTQYIDFYHDSYNDIFGNSSFFRPKIKIEFDPAKEQTTFAPQHKFQSGHLITFEQRFLWVRIRNRGHRTVHNCQAELKVLIPARTSENDLKKYPSDEAKPLTWGRHPQSLYELTPTRSIQARGSQLLHVIFSDSHFATTSVNAPKRYACISTKDRLEYEKENTRTYGGSARNLTVEDSFTNGEFVVEITVTSDEGPFATSKFLISVNSEWTNLTMRKISRLKTLLARRRKSN